MNSPHPKTALKIAIARTFAAPIDRRFYNSQELGLGAALLCHNFDVDVFVAGAGSGVQETVIEEHGDLTLRLIEVPMRKIPLIHQATMPDIRRYIKEGDYDWVHVNESNEIESWLTARVAHRRGIPVALYQGMYQPISGRIQRAFQYGFDRVCLKDLTRKTLRPLGKTEWAASYLRDRGFADAAVLPVGLNTKPFAQSLDVDWQARLGIPESNAIVAYVGIIEPRRRPDLILDLAEALREQPVSFVIVGEGPQKQWLTESIRLRNLTSVHVVGQIPQTELPSLYRASSILLLPSTYEIYGMVVLEAMYFGLPVVSSRTAGPSSIIESGLDGWLVDDMNTATWLKTVTTVLESPASIRKASEAATQKVASKLTWNHIAKNYSSIIQDSLASLKH